MWGLRSHDLDRRPAAPFPFFSLFCLFFFFLAATLTSDTLPIQSESSWLSSCNPSPLPPPTPSHCGLVHQRLMWPRSMPPPSWNCRHVETRRQRSFIGWQPSGRCSTSSEPQPCPSWQADRKWNHLPGCWQSLVKALPPDSGATTFDYSRRKESVKQLWGHFLSEPPEVNKVQGAAHRNLY